MKTYIPNPINTAHVEVPEDLMQLSETLARNVHNTWALERINQGWHYGTERNDTKKLHPCLVPYDELPESEKIFDRRTVLETIKVILGKGYQIKQDNRK